MDFIIFKKINSSVKDSLLGNSNPEQSATVHLVHNKQQNGSTTNQLHPQQVAYCETAVSTNLSSKNSRALEDIDNWSSNQANQTKRKAKANLQLNRSYSTACTPTNLHSAGTQSGTQTPKDQRSSSSKRKKKKLTNLKLSLSGGRLALATTSPSNLSDLILGRF